MRYIMFTISLVIVICGRSSAQKKLNEDSLLEARVQKVSQLYSFTTAQTSAYHSAEKQLRVSIDSVRNLKLETEKRREALRSVLRIYDQEVKAIVTPAQWAAMLETRRKTMEAREKYAKEHGQHVTFIPRDDQ